MCLAIPARIIELDGDKAVVDAMGNRFKAKTTLLPEAKLGSLVLVHAGFAISLVDAATIVVGTPTVLAGPHPAAVYATFLANLLRPKVKFVSVIGSFGWAGKTVEQLQNLMSNLKVEVIEPVLSKGYPKEEDFKNLDKLADSILDKHKELSLI